MKIIGLTGSIAMGKTDTARLFAEEGIPVFESDAVVHRLYSLGGKAVPAVQRLCPQAIVAGSVDRQRLSSALQNDPDLFDRLESAVHPLVREELDRFLLTERRKGTPLVLVDVPLLFEIGRQREFDVIVVVTAPFAVQKRRALARPDMTPEKLDLILARQLPDADKRARADFVVDTGKGQEFARSQVRQIVSQLSV
jgi:dephospho-CoA kinase